MKQYIRFCLLLLCAAVYAEDDAQTQNIMPWHDTAASYRIEVHQLKSEYPGVVDDRQICLPDTFANGVKAFDSDGNEIPAYTYETGAVFIPPAARDQDLYLYFGYVEKQENKTFPGLPKNERLPLYQITRPVAAAPAEWKDFEINLRKTRLDSLHRNYRLPQCDLKKCQKVRATINLCRMSLTPFCAWNVVFTQAKSKTSLWLDNPLRRFMICCHRFADLRPDYQASPHSHYRCLHHQWMELIRKYTAERNRLEQEIHDIPGKNPADELEKQLLNLAKEVKKSDLDAGQIFMTRRPTDTGDRSLLYFKSKLHVTESGKHFFRICSNATHILVIDGKRILRRFSDEITSDSKLYNETCVELEKGLHEFLLCYHKKEIGTWVSAAWKRPSDSMFHILAAEDFSSGLPVKPLAIRSQSGLRYPLAVFDDKFALFTGKRGRKQVYTFTNAEPASGPLSFRFQNTEYPETRNVFLADNDNKPDITIIPENKSFAPLTVVEHPRMTPRTAIPFALRFRLHLPLFLYDDETLSGTLETQSRLPFAFRTEIRESGDIVEILNIPPHQQEDADRFAPDLLFKQNIPLAGPELLTGKRAFHYELCMPGAVADRVSFAVRTPSESGEFTYRAGAFFDGETRLVFLLHRPNLSELRKWQFAKTISNGLKTTSKVFIASALPEQVTEEFSNILREKSIETEFQSIPDGHTFSGSPSLEALSNIARSLRVSGADAFLLVPPPRACKRNHSMRDELRAMAFLIEVARKTQGIRRIVLSLPVVPENADPEAENHFGAMMRTLKRNYEVELIAPDVLGRENIAQSLALEF